MVEVDLANSVAYASTCFDCDDLYNKQEVCITFTFNTAADDDEIPAEYFFGSPWSFKRKAWSEYGAWLSSLGLVCSIGTGEKRIVVSLASISPAAVLTFMRILINYMPLLKEENA